MYVLFTFANYVVKMCFTCILDQVAPHMRLRGGVEFLNEIPRNPSNKILRRVLKNKGNGSPKL